MRKYIFALVTGLVFLAPWGISMALDPIDEVRKFYRHNEIFTDTDLNADRQWILALHNEVRAYFPGTDSLKIEHLVADSLHGKAGGVLWISGNDTLRALRVRVDSVWVSRIYGLSDDGEPIELIADDESGTAVTTSWDPDTGWDMAGLKVADVGTPTADADAATKAYVDDAVSGSGGVTLAITGGGTGATTAAGARTNLGAEAADADLTKSNEVETVTAQWQYTGGSDSNNDLVNKAYVDDEVATAETADADLTKSNEVETITAQWQYTAGSNTDDDLVNKEYVDDAVAAGSGGGGGGGLAGNAVETITAQWQYTGGSDSDDDLVNKEYVDDAVATGSGVTLAITGGGTGATTAAGARTNLGAETADADLTKRNEVETVTAQWQYTAGSDSDDDLVNKEYVDDAVPSGTNLLAVTEGGTGANTANLARTNLGVEAADADILKRDEVETITAQLQYTGGSDSDNDIVNKAYVDDAVAAAGGAEVLRFDGFLNGNTGPGGGYTWVECALISASEVRDQDWWTENTGTSVGSSSAASYYASQDECSDGVCESFYELEDGVLICGN